MDTSKEIWAVVSNVNGEVLWSRGGSSTSKKLLVYSSENRAKAALNCIWIRQVVEAQDVKVIKIYG